MKFESKLKFIKLDIYYHYSREKVILYKLTINQNLKNRRLRKSQNYKELGKWNIKIINIIFSEKVVFL